MYAQPGLSAERKQRSLSSNRVGDVQQLPQVWRGGSGSIYRVHLHSTPCRRLADRSKKGRPEASRATGLAQTDLRAIVSIGHTTGASAKVGQL